jgi:hypothetical protein
VAFTGLTRANSALFGAGKVRMLAALRSGAPKMSNSKRDRMTRIVFNSGDFAPGVAEEKRRKLWIDLYSDIYGTPDVRFLENRPFQVNFNFTNFGSVTVGQCDGTVNNVKRSASYDADGPDIYYLIVNRSPTRIAYYSRYRPEVVLGAGEMTLASPADVREARYDPADSRYDIVTIPRVRLLEHGQHQRPSLSAQQPGAAGGEIIAPLSRYRRRGRGPAYGAGAGFACRNHARRSHFLDAQR